MEITFKRLITSVRPSRNVVFINTSDEGWQQSVLRIIEGFSNTWGGNGNIIIPTDGKTIKEAYWAILEKYKPDHCFVYVKSNRDIKEGDPNIYAAAKKQLKESLSLKRPELKENHVDKIIDQTFTSTKGYETFQLSADLSKEILTRLNPFHIGGKIVEPLRLYNLNAKSNIFLGEVFRELPDEQRLLVDYELDEMPISFQLLTRCYVGSSKILLQNYNSRGSNRPMQMRASYPKLAETIHKLEPNDEAIILNQLSDTTDAWLHTPFGSAEYGLSRYRTEMPLQTPIIIVGDSQEDYLLFYSLNRLTDSVFWIPKYYADLIEEKYEFFYSLVAAIETSLITNYTEEMELMFTSFSENEQYIQNLIGKIKALSPISTPGDELLEMKVTSPEEAVKGINPYFYVEHHNAHASTVQQFVNNVASNILNTPKPTIFKDLNSSLHRWIIDLEIDKSTSDPNDTGFILPPIPGVLGKLFDSEAMSIDEQTGYIRNIGSKYSFICPHNRIFYSNQPIDHVIPKPLLKLQDTFSIFENIFGLQGYQIEVSDKGKYMDAAVELFGTLSALAIELKDTQVRAALDCFTDLSKPNVRKANNIAGVNLHDTIYLSYADFLSHFDEESFGNKLDRFLNIGLFTRGYILQCNRCSQADWYRFGELTEEFTCKRCLRKQIFDSKSWKKGSEPSIYYKLDEMFYQGYKNNMHVSVLALFTQQQEAKRSFLYHSELKLTKKDNPNERFEFDILCIKDGILIIGEAKSSEDNLGKPEKKQIGNYQKMINSTNGVFLFACSSVKQQQQDVINQFEWKNKPIFLSTNELAEPDEPLCHEVQNRA